MTSPKEPEKKTLSNVYTASIECKNPSCKTKPSEEKFKVCSRCKLWYYCSVECQKANWNAHKPHCHSHTQKENQEQWGKLTDRFISENGQRLVEYVDIVCKKANLKTPNKVTFIFRFNQICCSIHETEEFLKEMKRVAENDPFCGSIQRDIRFMEEILSKEKDLKAWRETENMFGIVCGIGNTYGAKLFTFGH